MRIGVVFPQTEIGADADAVRSYAEHAEALGFAHLLAYDHVVGADREVHAGWNGPYDLQTTFHEPLVTFGYLAAITTSLELATGVVILRSVRPFWSPSRPPKWTYSAAAGCAWESGSAGTRSSMRLSEKTFRRGANAATNRSS